MRYQPKYRDGNWIVWDVVDQKPAGIPGISTSGLFRASQITERMLEREDIERATDQSSLTNFVSKKPAG